MFETFPWLASIGFITATVNLISGLQLTRKGEVAVIERIMHRLNGYLSLFICILLIIQIFGGTWRRFLFFTLIVGLVLYLMKIWIVRVKRGKKYGSHIGIMLFITWFVVIYVHIYQP